MKKRLAASSFLLAFLLAFSACNAPVLITDLPGDYDGLIMQKNGNETSQSLVTGKLSLHDLALRMDLTASVTGQKWSFEISMNDGYKLVASPTFPTDHLLKPDSLGCFSDAALTLCFDRKEITLKSADGATDDFYLVLDRYDPSATPALETPKVYSVSELISHAKAQSFDTQIAFQKAEQGRYKAEAAYLNLLPNFGISSFFSSVKYGNLFQSMSTLLQGVSNLAPFLIPSRWIAAHESVIQARIDKEAYEVMKADTANTVEGLSYAYLRDTKVLAKIKQYDAPMESLYETMVEKEKMGVIAKGSSLALASVLDSLHQSEILMAQAIQTDRHSLATASGFISPDAVEDISPEIDLTIERPLQIDTALARKVVIERSIERQEIENLIKIAKEGVVTGLIGWLDPFNFSSTIGPALPATFMVNKSQVKMLVLQGQQLESTLLEKLADSLQAMSSALQSYDLAKKDAEVQAERVKILTDEMAFGMVVDISQLQNALQMQFQSESNLINYEFAYYVAASNFNRLTYSGTYN